MAPNMPIMRAPMATRTPTGPPYIVAPRSKKGPPLDTSQPYNSRASPSSRRPSKRRKMTTSAESNEVWNELNDRDALPSPISHSAELERRPRSGTLPARRKDDSSTWLDQVRRRSWFDSIGASDRRTSGVFQGKQRVNSSSALLDHPDPEDETHFDADTPTSPALGQPVIWGSHTNQDGLGDWLKLKWWRKRWRDEPGEGNNEGT